MGSFKDKDNDPLITDRNARTEQLDTDRNAGAEQLDTDRNAGAEQPDTDRNAGAEQLDTDRNAGAEQLDTDRNAGAEQLDTDRNTEDEPLITALPLLYRLVLTGTVHKRLGLTKTQLIIMLSLSHFESLRMSQIAEFISSSKEQATRAVAPLVEEGYVCRTNDPENRTYIEIRLTEVGMAFIEQWHSNLLEQIDSQLSRDISDDERSELRQAAQSMVKILSKLR